MSTSRCRSARPRRPGARADRARHAVEHDAWPERLGDVTGDEGSKRRRHGGTCGRAADERLGKGGRSRHRIEDTRACEHLRMDSLGPRRRSRSSSSMPTAKRVGVRVADARQPGTDFGRARLVDVELVRCDLSGCDFSESHVAAGAARRLPVVGDRAAAGEAPRASVRRLQARRRQLPPGAAATVQLRGSLLGRRGVHGGDARRRRRSTAATSPGSTSRRRGVREVDLRGARLDGLRGAGSLSGATIGVDQLFGLAPALAQAIGLRIAEPDADPPAN